MLGRGLGLDERSKRKLEESSTVVLLMFYIVCPLEMIIKMIVTRDPSSALGELIIYFLVIFTFPIVQRLNKNYSPLLPRKDNGEELSTGNTKLLKCYRLLYYVKDSLRFAFMITIFSLILNYFLHGQELSRSSELIKTQMSQFLIYFIVFFVITAIGNERKIKKYNLWNKRSDE